MQITEIKEGALTIAVVEGRLDTTTSVAAEQKLMALLGAGGVVADLAGVTYVSSAGLRILLKAAKQAKTSRVSFCICAPQAPVFEVIQMSGFDKIIPSYASREIALSAACVP